MASTWSNWIKSKLVREWFAFLCVLAVTAMVYLAATSGGIDTVPAECTNGDPGCRPNYHQRRPTKWAKKTYNTDNLQPCTNGERERHLEKVCENWRTNRHIRWQDPGHFWSLFVDDTHKVLYCIVPKAGTTSIQTMIINTTGQLLDKDEMAVHDPLVLERLNFRYLHQYPYEEIIWRLEHYYKFTVVRHPLERLYSAYMDKIRNFPFFKERYGHIIKKYFPAQDPSINLSPLTLEEFLTLVANEYDTGYKDRHWATINEICHPCDIRYDYIGKLETINEDLPQIVNLFADKAGRVPDFPSLHHQKKRTEVHDKYKDIDPSIMRRIYSLYQQDLELFGYSWQNQTSSFCEVKDDNNRRICC